MVGDPVVRPSQDARALSFEQAQAHGAVGSATWRHFMSPLAMTHAHRGTSSRMSWLDAPTWISYVPGLHREGRLATS